MSVLVKGMKKPKSCGECHFLVYSHYRPMCYVTKQIPIYQLSETLEQVLSKRMYGCPLVEVNSCDICEIAEYTNPEDDDTPCFDFEEVEDGSKS